MKTIIITGANGNLGLTVTNEFLEKGYRVIGTVINQSMTGDFPKHDNLKIQVVDLSDETATEVFVKECIDRYKVIDGALLLAGGFAMGKIAETDSKLLKKQLALNFETAYNIVRPLFPAMLERGEGRLIFIGARPALKVSQGKNMVAYGLSKSLLFKFAEYINEEAKGKDLTATVIVPSTIDTPANRASMPDAKFADWVDPARLAGIMEFIISDKASPLRETVLKVYNNA